MKFQSDYDRWHARNQELDPGHDDASTPWYSWLEQVLGDVQGLRVLEVACGRGGFLKRLSKAGARAYGMDFSFAAVRLAKAKTLDTDPPVPACVVQGDAHALPFPDGVFDVIISCETIEHLPYPEKAVGEFYRVARPGALLYLTTPNYLNFMGLYEIYSKFRHPGRKGDQPFDRLQMFSQTRALLKHAGWRITASDGMVHQLPLIPGRNPVPLEGLDSNVFLRRALRIFAYHYCLIARKEEV